MGEGEDDQEEQEQSEAAPFETLDAVFKKVMAAKKAASNQKTAKNAAKMLQEALGGLTDEDFRQIIASDEMQELLGTATAAASGTKPGDAVYDDRGREVFRVPYSYSWVEENMPAVTWMVPQHPFGRRVWEPPSWNGISCPVALRVNTEVTTPVCFRDIVMDSFRQTTGAIENQQHVLAGVGARAADGVSLEAGWKKDTEEDLLASGQWVRR
jgi:hypothetical protein